MILRSEYNRKAVIQQIMDAPLPIQVVVEPYKTRRTTSQNSQYFVWCREIAAYTGNNEKTIHDLLRFKFLPMQVIELKDIKQEALTSTTQLDVEQFTEFLSDIQIWAEIQLDLQLGDR